MARDLAKVKLALGPQRGLFHDRKAQWTGCPRQTFDWQEVRKIR
jgi:hypothetical protein